jgi:hypothetical protein
MKPYPVERIHRFAFNQRMYSLVASLASMVGVVAMQVHAGYSVSWFKVAAGGGTSTNRQYSLRGTLGQHDAGEAMRGGNFAVTGGFWSIAVVQSPGAPALRIFLTANHTTVIAWPASSTGWTLEQCGDLAVPNWLPVSSTASLVGDEYQVTFASPMGNRFFRLAHPYPQDNH